MNYSQAEQFLLSLSNLSRNEYMNDKQRTADYLQRVQFFLNLIGNPEKKIPHYIHVTGTSGKGSVCSFLSSILKCAGYQVGLTISPHPITLRERWQVNNTIMSEKEFIAIIQTLKPALDEYAKKSPYDIVSFFDLTTIIALLYFAQKKVDWAVVEVGCGGRLDSTNVIPHKDIAVITNIGFDHMEILGNTKEKIAFEKAGIIQPGCAVFTAETNKKVLAVIEKECKKNKVGLYKINNVNQFPSILPHQLQNTALCTAIAQHLRISESTSQKGLQTTKQPLRMEVISQNPLIILDSAHNEDKIKSTVEATESIISNMSNKRSDRTSRTSLHLIVGFSANKDIPTLIKALASLKPKTVACTRNTVNSFRKATHPKELQKLFQKYSPTAKIEIFLDPQDAFVWSKAQTKTSALLLVTGSIFLSGEIKTFLRFNTTKRFFL